MKLYSRHVLCDTCFSSIVITDIDFVACGIEINAFLEYWTSIVNHPVKNIYEKERKRTHS